MALVDGAVEVGEELVSQFQVLAADRLDSRVVQLGGFGVGRVSVGPDLVRGEITGVPAPGEPELPRAPVRAEKRAEGR